MDQKSVWNQLTQLPFLGLYTKLLTAAMELDVFSQLSEKITAKELAKKGGWNEANTDYLLRGLTSVGFVKMDGDSFHNSDEAERYLVKGKPDYLGGFLLYYTMNEGTMPMDVKKLVTEGPQSMQQQAMDGQLDFAQYGGMLRQAQQGYRQQELLRMIRALPENDSIKTVLDVGCATGLLGLSVVADRPHRTGVLFDQLPPALLQESVEMMQLKGRVKVMSGNFMTDDLGKGYDLILAVSIMLFARGHMETLLQKFYDALNPGGVLLVISEGIDLGNPGPWDMLMGYLPYYFQGMDMGVRKNEIAEAAERAGFTKFEKRTELLCSGTQDIDIIRK